jgi:hypothetical protein
MKIIPFYTSVLVDELKESSAARQIKIFVLNEKEGNILAVWHSLSRMKRPVAVFTIKPKNHEQCRQASIPLCRSGNNGARFNKA